MEQALQTKQRFDLCDLRLDSDMAAIESASKSARLGASLEGSDSP
jgi:hypothetical protein